MLTDIERGLAACRASESLIRTLGGKTVQIHLRLGDKVDLSPVIERRKTPKGKVEFLIPAIALTKLNVNDLNAAKELFDTCIGLSGEGSPEIKKVAIVESDEFGGIPFLYRVTTL